MKYPKYIDKGLARLQREYGDDPNVQVVVSRLIAQAGEIDWDSPDALCSLGFFAGQESGRGGVFYDIAIDYIKEEVCR